MTVAQTLRWFLRKIKMWTKASRPWPRALIGRFKIGFRAPFWRAGMWPEWLLACSGRSAVLRPARPGLGFGPVTVTGYRWEMLTRPYTLQRAQKSVQWRISKLNDPVHVSPILGLRHLFWAKETQSQSSKTETPLFYFNYKLPRILTHGQHPFCYLRCPSQSTSILSGYLQCTYSGILQNSSSMALIQFLSRMKNVSVPPPASYFGFMCGVHWLWKGFGLQILAMSSAKMPHPYLTQCFIEWGHLLVKDCSESCGTR